jgi:hypothetical protein
MIHESSNPLIYLKKYSKVYAANAVAFLHTNVVTEYMQAWLFDLLLRGNKWTPFDKFLHCDKLHVKEL